MRDSLFLPVICLLCLWPMVGVGIGFILGRYTIQVRLPVQLTPRSRNARPTEIKSFEEQRKAIIAQQKRLRGKTAEDLTGYSEDKE